MRERLYLISPVDFKFGEKVLKIPGQDLNTELITLAQDLSLSSLTVALAYESVNDEKTI